MRKHKKGFTIVELVIVIGVIGILSAILIPTFVNVTQNAKDAALQSNLSNAYSAYAAEAADRVVDETKEEIVFKAQKDVSLTFEGETYVFSETNKKWETGAAKANFVVTVKGTGNEINTEASTTKSTFNNAIVKYDAE